MVQHCNVFVVGLANHSNGNSVSLIEQGSESQWIEFTNSSTELQHHLDQMVYIAHINCRRWGQNNLFPENQLPNKLDAIIGVNSVCG